MVINFLIRYHDLRFGMNATFRWVRRIPNLTVATCSPTVENRDLNIPYLIVYIIAKFDVY